MYLCMYIVGSGLSSEASKEVGQQAEERDEDDDDSDAKSDSTQLDSYCRIKTCEYVRYFNFHFSSITQRG